MKTKAPFTINLNDFDNYTHTQTLAFGAYSKGTKKFEVTTLMIDGKLEFGMRIMQTYTDNPSKIQGFMIYTFEEGIEKFNSII